jgi:PPOX class probable F420-dependent enzyme
MRMSAEQARARFAVTPVARLATADAAGVPHLVPIVFALVGDALYFVVDDKPKASAQLRRLANIRANPRVGVLVDRYDDDWDKLWWARADGTARVLDDFDETATAALARRYPRYHRSAPPGPMVEIAVDRWSGWSAT